jgi:hypothetical protein
MQIYVLKYFSSISKSSSLKLVAIAICMAAILSAPLQVAILTVVSLDGSLFVFVFTPPLTFAVP